MNGVQGKSTSLRSVHYDAVNKILQVELYVGGSYHYADVPANIYDEMLQAESPFQFFERNIRLKFRHRRVLQI